MATAKKPVMPRATARKATAKKAAPGKAPVAKAASRGPSKPAASSSAAKGAPVKSAKPEKPKKPKLVRDSFTIPKAEYTVLDGLKQRAAKAGMSAKKSEVLRAGIKLLATMGDAAFAAAMGAVPAIKTGRPAKH